MKNKKEQKGTNKNLTSSSLDEIEKKVELEEILMILKFAF
jgi:hypothetical protein